MATQWLWDQLENAKTIVTVGRSMGASDRDVTIALATAMQESSLKNLPGGDRDSAGLFQQRPSMGWGTYDQVTDPQYAARKFYTELFKVKNRDSMTIAQAAQTVQKSAYPDAYAKWEDEARKLAVIEYEGSGVDVSGMIPESVTTGLDNVNNAFSAITNPDMWKRIGVGALGVVLVIVGIVIILSTSEAVKKSASAVAGVVSKGVIK